MQLLKRVISWFKERRDKVFWCGVALIAGTAVAMTIPTISHQQLGFDEGWNLQAPYELAKEGKYASFGAVFDGQTKTFDPYLSTGPAVSLPMAAVFKVFGTGVVQARVVMLLFYLLAMVLVAWYVYERTRSLYALLAPLSFLLISSAGLVFRIEALGEMAAVAYGVGSLLAWRRGWYALAGLLAVLAMFSKFLMLLLVVAGFMAFAIMLLRRLKYWKSVLGQAVRWTAGVAAPLLLWEVLRFVQLGGSLGAYKYNLKEFYRVFRDNGSGLGETGTQGLTIPHKFFMVVSNITMSEALMVVAGIVLVAGFVLGYRKLRSAVADNFLGLAFVALYAFWWFFVSNGGYPRYTLPLCIISIAIVLQAFLRVLPDAPPRARQAGLALKATLLAVFLLALHSFYVPYPVPVYRLTLEDQQRVAAKIEAAKPGHLVHIGWWQNPEMLFMTGLHSTEYSHIKIGDSYYLLLSPALRDIVPKEYQEFQTLCKDVIFSDSGYILCSGIKYTERNV